MSAIIAWNADNLTLRRIDVTSMEPALYAGPKVRCHGARDQLAGPRRADAEHEEQRVVIRNGTGRLTDVLALGGGTSNTAGVRFFPATRFGNQFALRNVTAIGGTGSGSAGIFIDGAADRTATVTGRNMIARGSTRRRLRQPDSTLTLDHSFVATIMMDIAAPTSTAETTASPRRAS